MAAHTKPPQLGLRANWQQFTLLVLINAFVGGMVGLERSIFPAFAAEVFGLSSKTAILSFIIAFGFSKAITNYYTGRLANRFGRRNLLIIGWLLALPIPFLLIYATQWEWVVAANVLLGISQGLTWSSTVVMKIDLVGSKERGLAMGLNEFAGYLAVGIAAYLTSYLSSRYGIRPYPFYLGIAFSVMGLLLSLIFVKDTRSFVQQESHADSLPPLPNVFVGTSFTHKSLSAITQAGLVNNLNDGMMWGIFPLLLASLHFSGQNIGILAAVYPTVWGLGQLFTGKLADIYNKKYLLITGMALQGIAILSLPYLSTLAAFIGAGILLGLGTALVYPTFLTAIASAVSPMQRAESLGTFRFWRDAGYAIGAIISGIVADSLGLHAAILLTGGITLFSALVLWRRMA